MRDWTKKYIENRISHLSESQRIAIRKEGKIEMMKSKLAKLKKHMKSKRKRKQYYKNINK